MKLKQNSKFAIETSPIFKCYQMVMIPPKYLDIDENKALFEVSNFHHYMIVKKPKVFYEDIIITHQTIKYDLYIKNKEQKKAYSFQVPNTFNCIPKIKYNDYKSYVELYENETIFLASDAGLLFPRLCKIAPAVCKDGIECEILYIGQAFGKNGSRTAIQRLNAHPTLQKILSDNQDNIFDEIQVILMDFFPPCSTYINVLGNLNGTSPEIGINDSIKHKDYIMKTGFTPAQKVNIIEASMIRWFEPPYNEKLKESFPDPLHKSYSEGYNLDVNNFIFEIDSNSIGCKLYSQKIPASFYHSGHIPLYPEDIRKDVFSIIRK